MKIVVSIFFVLIYASSTQAYSEQKSLNAQQASKYLGHIIDRLFIPGSVPMAYTPTYVPDHEAHMSSIEHKVERFNKKYTERILSTTGSYEHFYSRKKKYTADALYAQLLTEALGYIKSKSTNYARKSAQKLFKSVVINQHEIALAIAERIYHEAKEIIEKAQIVPQGALSSFIGVNLRNKVYKYIQEAFPNGIYVPLEASSYK